MSQREHRDCADRLRDGDPPASMYEGALPFNPDPADPPEGPPPEPPKVKRGRGRPRKTTPTDTKKPRNQTVAMAEATRAMLGGEVEWAQSLWWNEFSVCTIIRGEVPWKRTGRGESWAGLDDIDARIWFEEHDIWLDCKSIVSVISRVSDDQRYHPVREYLLGLRWDRIPRIDSWLASAFGAPSDPYHRAVGRCTLIAAVARVMKPGCKHDQVLVLEGPGGIGKSRTVRALACGDDETGAWFADDHIDIGDKDGAIALCGKWIVELAELSSLQGKTSDSAKAFFSRQVDNYRPPYGIRNVDVSRQSIFIGTTNEKEYLDDPNGNRRYWCVRAKTGNETWVRANRDQLWAEALFANANGEDFYLDPANEALAVIEQCERLRRDPWEDLVLHAIKGIAGDFTTAEILTKFDKPPGQWTRWDEIRIGAIMRGLGFDTVRKRHADGSRRRVYVLAATAKAE